MKRKEMQDYIKKLEDALKSAETRIKEADEQISLLFKGAFELMQQYKLQDLIVEAVQDGHISIDEGREILDFARKD